MPRTPPWRLRPLRRAPYFSWGPRKGGRTLRKDVFLPSKRLLSAFYKTLPSKNPSKNLVFAENPYSRLLGFLLRLTVQKLDV